MNKHKFIITLAGLMLAASMVLAGGKREEPAPEKENLTIYSGRSEELVGPIIDQFSGATGIEVRVRYGSTSEIAATILEEGRNSPADVFYAQDPGVLGAVEQLFTRIPESILNQVEPRFRSQTGKWVGISGRARVVVYNTERFNEADLPDDIWDFTDPEWRDRIGWAPTNASFQAMVTSMQVLWGEEKTSEWIMGIQANQPKLYPKNTPIVAAVGASEIDVGFVNHYYLYRFIAEEGESFAARNYHPRGGGPGAVILVSGAGILNTSRNKETAERFIKFMLSKVAQQYFAGQTFEYPVIEGVKTHHLLTPVKEINSPEIAMSDMSDLEATLAHIRETGVFPLYGSNEGRSLKAKG
ncbi:MAG: iron ABC transporter substrate-binding protein [Spirochaetes bacterium]|nr:MAG: iron ABC transporter substrate-binding protein [Spirochaetota bacterium]